MLSWQTYGWQLSSPETIGSMTNTTEQHILSLYSAVSSTLAPVQFPETPELWAASFSFNSCKTLCRSVGTVSSWKLTDPLFLVLFCFVFWFSLSSRKILLLPVPLNMSPISTFDFKDSHSRHRCAKANSIKAISMHSQPWYEFIFIPLWDKMHVFVFHHVFPNPT